MIDLRFLREPVFVGSAIQCVSDGSGSLLLGSQDSMLVLGLPLLCRHFMAAKGSRGQLSRLLSNEIPISQLLRDDLKITIHDDLPFNEYFLIRQLLDGP
jgi:hypothetical protein